MDSHVAALHDYLDARREQVLAEIRRRVPDDSRYWAALYQPMLDYPLRGAKMLRPAICIATCRALGGQEQSALPTAAVLELYHNAFLIHDDIQDGSELRRGEPTLHLKYGTPVAINVGDAMLALALSPLLDNMRLIGMGPAMRILQTVAEMARESAEGQALELDWVRRNVWTLDDADYLHMVHKKSAWYSFIAPVLLGAIVARVYDDRARVLTDYAANVGVAFQIQDDIVNLTSSADVQGKEQAGDPWEGKRTLILLHALRTATADDRARAVEILARPRPREERGAMWFELEALAQALFAEGHLTETGRAAVTRWASGPREREAKSASDVGWLLELVHRTGSIAHARGVALRHAGAARQCLLAAREWLPPSVHQQVLETMVDFVVGRDK